MVADLWSGMRIVNGEYDAMVGCCASANSRGEKFDAVDKASPGLREGEQEGVSGAI